MYFTYLSLSCCMTLCFSRDLKTRQAGWPISSWPARAANPPCVKMERLVYAPAQSLLSSPLKPPFLFFRFTRRVSQARGLSGRATDWQTGSLGPADLWRTRSMEPHDKRMKFTALFREETWKSVRFDRNTTGGLTLSWHLVCFPPLVKRKQS